MEEEEEEEAEGRRRLEKASGMPPQRADIHHGHPSREDKRSSLSVRRFHGSRSAAKDARLLRVPPARPPPPPLHPPCGIF